LLFVFLRKSHPQDIAILENSISDKIEFLNTENLAIKFFSNNQDWIKLFLKTKWKFVYFIPTIYEIGGIHIKELIDSYPYFDSGGVLHIIKKYQMNFILIDSNSYVEIEELESLGKHVEKIMEGEFYKLYKINW
jgi:hypothetical protein